MHISDFNRRIIACSLAGILLSTYALYVEMAAEGKPGYKALCDLSEYAKCSRVLTSRFSKGFGLVPRRSVFEIFEVPNCVYGIIFYCIIIFLATFNNETAVKTQLTLSLIAMVTCAYLAYLLVYVLQDFCVVCVSTYCANAGITYYVHGKLNRLKEKEE